MEKKEPINRLQFPNFTDLYEQNSDSKDCFCVGKIASITISIHNACKIVISSPEGRYKTSLQITIYNNGEFPIHKDNKDEYVGQYVLFSYLKRHEQICLHYFTSDAASLLQDVISEEHVSAFEASIQEDQIELLHHKKTARYKRPLISLVAIFMLWKRNRRKKKQQAALSLVNAVIPATE